METMTLGQMLQVSIAMPILLGVSVLVLSQALERCYHFWAAEPLPTRFWDRVRDLLEKEDKVGALAVCQHTTGTVPEAIAALLELERPDTEGLVETFQLYRQRMHMGLNRRLGVFGTASFVAPLIGLWGTVLGIMRAFHDLSVAGAGGPTVVAAGISEALVATAAGIGVAVASAVLYNFFTLTARHRMNTLDLWVLELARLLRPRPKHA